MARVQFSNAFGTQPLQLSDVHIAQRMSGSSVSPGTDRGVTFGGQTETSVAAGGVAISDPIAFPVSALSDVAISVYLPQPTGPTTYHQQGTQTNYIASGDVSANVSLGGAQATASYYLLANLDVQGVSSAGAVVTLGASITDGFASAQDANHRWPNYLAVRLAGADLGVGVLNQGINGNKLLVDGSGQSAVNRFNRDVVSQPGARWVIFSDDPINDLGSSSPPSADQLIAAATQIIAAAHANGIKFLCSTLTPFKGASGWTQDGETGRQGFDSFVRSAQSGCDGVVDEDVATHDPANPTQFLPAYDSGDHLHPNDAGRQAIANAVDLGLFSTRALSYGGDAGSASMSEAGVDASDALASDAGAEAASYTSDAEPSNAMTVAGEALPTEGGAVAGRPDAGRTPASVDGVSDAGEPKTVRALRSVGCSAAGASSQGQSWGLALVVLGMASARRFRRPFCVRRLGSPHESCGLGWVRRCRSA
jgi:MYXO-CTERM domain-containing protein